MVNMWVYEEVIDGKKLTEIINTEHENVKYLPGHKLPRNVVSAPIQGEFQEAVSSFNSTAPLVSTGDAIQPQS